MGYSLNFCVLLNSSLIAVNHHVPAGLAEGELILLGDLIKHTAGCQHPSFLFRWQSRTGFAAVGSMTFAGKFLI